MSWSIAITGALASPPYSWAWLLTQITIGASPGAAYTASSLPDLGDPVIGRAIRINGSSLSPGSWRTTLGTFTVELVGDLSTLKQSLTRGSFVALKIGKPGWAAGDYEAVVYGQVQQLSARTITSGTLTCRDLLSALRSRPVVNPALLALGWRLGYRTHVSTTLTSAYTPGDSTLYLASLSGFAVGSAGSAVLVTPTSGDPFILTYLGTSGSHLTSVSLIGKHGTTAVAAASGDTVQPLVWGKAHPIDLAREFLCSINGAGANTYDVLPDGDGLSIPTDYIDVSDCDNYKAVSGSGMDWEVVATEKVDNVLAWMQGWLAAGGFYMTIRMGLITVRAAQDSSTTLSDMAQISDDDIEAGGITWEAWDPDTPEEYAETAVTSSTGVTDSGHSSTNLATLPGVYEKEYDVSEYLFTTGASGLADRQSIVDRVWEAHERVPERYVVNCIGLSPAKLAPGDWIRITSRQVAGRLSTTLAGLDNTRALVVQVSPDFGTGRVRLVVLVYPTGDGEFP